MIKLFSKYISQNLPEQVAFEHLIDSLIQSSKLTLTAYPDDTYRFVGQIENKEVDIRYNGFLFGFQTFVTIKNKTYVMYNQNYILTRKIKKKLSFFIKISKKNKFGNDQFVLDLTLKNTRKKTGIQIK